MDPAETKELPIVYPAPGAEPGVDDHPRNPLALALAPLKDQSNLLYTFRMAFLADGDWSKREWVIASSLRAEPLLRPRLLVILAASTGG
jgi:hypothetical protein